MILSNSASTRIATYSYNTPLKVLCNEIRRICYDFVYQLISTKIIIVAPRLGHLPSKNV